MAHEGEYKGMKKGGDYGFIKTSNTGGRSTTKTNMRKKSYKNPKRRNMPKQKIPTIMNSKGY